MKQKVKDYLIGKGYIPSSIISKELSENPADIRNALNSLIDDGVVSKIGKKRGTKYALTGTELPTECDSLDLEKRIIAFLTGNGWVSSTIISNELSESQHNIRTVLKSMIETEKVSKIGNKRSTKYATKGTSEPVKIIPEDHKDQEINEEIKVKSVDELVLKALSYLNPNKSYSVLELANKICDKIPSQFSVYDVVKQIPISTKKGVLVGFMSRTPEGNRAVYMRVEN